MTTYNAVEQLGFYRKTIDNLDSALLYILAERFRCTEQVGELKARHEMPATDNERERRQMVRLRDIAANLDLDQQFVENLMHLIVGTVVERHKEIAGEKNEFSRGSSPTAAR